MDVLCPIDQMPCEKNCPDRYRDRPEGGCLLTTLLERVDSALLIYDPSKEEKTC